MKTFLPYLKTLGLAAQITLASALGLWADAPPGYYVTAEGQSGQALRSALHQIINNHHVIPYSGGATDVTAALKILDQASSPAKTPWQGGFVYCFSVIRDFDPTLVFRRGGPPKAGSGLE